MTWFLFLVALFMALLVAAWFINGYRRGGQAGLTGFWDRVRHDFDDSATKVFAHFLQFIGWASVAAPEGLQLLNSYEGANLLRTFWPEYAGGVLVVVAFLIVIFRNRTLNRAAT
jgi:hypothetical protein